MQALCKQESQGKRISIFGEWASTPDAGASAPVNEEAVKALDETSIIRVQAKPDRTEHLVMQKDMPEEQLKSWFKVWQTVKAS